MIAYAIIAAVALQRIAELIWGRRNAQRLFARGAVEVGRSHYPFVMALHIAWFAAMIVFMPNPPEIAAVPLIVFLLLQIARLWVFAALGPYFTTRLVTLPGAALVETGPYRFMRHPNYVVVVGEILLLPLVFGEVAVAVVFSALNAAILLWRIRVEDAALAERR